MLLFLEQEKWVARDKNGELRATTDEILMEPTLASFLQAEWNEHFLKLALASVRKCDRSTRVHRGYTMAVRKTNIDLVRQKVLEFARDIATLVEEPSDGEEVYQLQIAFFPLSRSKANK
jgi:uncharacterized protein (TIGR02147 family)